MGIEQIVVFILFVLSLCSMVLSYLCYKRKEKRTNPYLKLNIFLTLIFVVYIITRIIIDVI